MAIGADFDLDVLSGRARFNHVAANASDGCFFIIRVNAYFHFSFFLLVLYRLL
jgi:hypothetical protein